MKCQHCGRKQPRGWAEEYCRYCGAPLIRGHDDPKFEGCEVYGYFCGIPIYQKDLAIKIKVHSERYPSDYPDTE